VRNAVRDSGIAIGTILGAATRVAGNEVEGGQDGVELTFERDGEVLDNVVTETVGFGIVALQPVGRLTVRGNRVVRCGYVPVNQGAAYGILVLDGVAAVAIDGCEVLDTGEAPPEKPPFTKARFGVRVRTEGSATIRGCRVSSTPLPQDALDPSSRAILVDAIGGDERIRGEIFADVTDNVAEQEGVAIVEVASMHGAVWTERDRRRRAPRRGLQPGPRPQGRAVPAARPGNRAVGGRQRHDARCRDHALGDWDRRASGPVRRLQRQRATELIRSASMDLTALEPILELRVATLRALAEQPIPERGARSELAEEAREARKRARAPLDAEDDDAERLIAAIVSASREPLSPPPAPARKRAGARRKKS
jgi:hypothetical protein